MLIFTTQFFSGAIIWQGEGGGGITYHYLQPGGPLTTKDQHQQSVSPSVCVCVCMFVCCFILYLRFTSVCTPLESHFILYFFLHQFHHFSRSLNELHWLSIIVSKFVHFIRNYLMRMHLVCFTTLIENLLWHFHSLFPWQFSSYYLYDSIFTPWNTINKKNHIRSFFKITELLAYLAGCTTQTKASKTVT